MFRFFEFLIFVAFLVLSLNIVRYFICKASGTYEVRGGLFHLSDKWLMQDDVETAKKTGKRK